MNQSRRLLARLRQDLSELRDDPYPGVAVFTDDANLRKLCLVLTPSSGPFTGLALHFDVELPDDWPSSPPRVSSSVNGIAHPNLFGDYICCDLLRPAEDLANGYTGGYSPALTLRGLFLQFLTFFSSRKVEQEHGRDSVLIGDYIEVIYLPESSLENHLNQHSNHPVYHCSCRDVKFQDQFSNTWEKDPGTELLIRSFKDSNGHRVTHSAKYIAEKYSSIHRITGVNYRWTKTSRLISTWSCWKCPYGSSSLPHRQDTKDVQMGIGGSMMAPFMRTPSTCCLSILNDDVLGELALYLSSESVVSLSEAYPRFREIVALFHVLLRKELNCFFLRTSLNESILGIGVSLDPGSRKLSSDFDWLSMEAFDDFDIRRSIQKRVFQHFLPLAFNRAHFKKAQAQIWTRLREIDDAVCAAEAAISRKTRRPSTRRVTPPLKVHHTVEVLYRMMNNIVVSLMESCDNAMAKKANRATLLYNSEKAIVSYCHLFHLLIRLSVATPSILFDATWKLRKFITKPETRLKNETPDMGELIVMIILVLVLPSIDQEAPLAWEAICGKFLEEAVTRNVRWVLDASPELEVLENGVSEYRLLTTFEKSKTSFRLMMFQVTFLDMFIRTYSSDISILDNNYGFAEKELPEQMVSEIKAIYAVDTWTKFFGRVKFVRGVTLGEEAFCDMLRTAVHESGARRYHFPSSQTKIYDLRRARATLERQFKSSMSSRWAF